MLFRTIRTLHRNTVALLSGRPMHKKLWNGQDEEQQNPIPAQMPDPTRERVLVIAIAGQSNGSNRGPEITGVQPTYPRILNFHKGKVYLARHPLIGNFGKGRSPWIEMACLLLEADIADKIVLVPMAVGGTSVKEWASGVIHKRFVRIIRAAERAGLPINFMVWHQGERDARDGMLRGKHERHLRKVIDTLRSETGRPTPVFIALATLMREHPINETLRSAQQHVADSDGYVFVASDTDRLGFDFRYDGVHFNAEGQDIIAKDYAEAILAFEAHSVKSPAIATA